MMQEQLINVTPPKHHYKRKILIGLGVVGLVIVLSIILVIAQQSVSKSIGNIKDTNDSDNDLANAQIQDLKNNNNKLNDELKTLKSDHNYLSIQLKALNDLLYKDQETWLTYKNKQYGYTIKYPRNWKISSVSILADPSTASIVLFKNSVDPNPTNTGFSIHVEENPEGLDFIDLCPKYTEAKEQGILCNPDKLRLTRLSQNPQDKLKWDKVEKNSLSFTPNGNVLYVLNYRDRLYYIVDRGTNREVIDLIRPTFATTLD